MQLFCFLTELFSFCLFISFLFLFADGEWCAEWEDTKRSTTDQFFSFNCTHMCWCSCSSIIIHSCTQIVQLLFSHLKTEKSYRKCLWKAAEYAEYALTVRACPSTSSLDEKRCTTNCIGRNRNKLPRKSKQCHLYMLCALRWLCDVHCECDGCSVPMHWFYN